MQVREAEHQRQPDDADDELEADLDVRLELRNAEPAGVDDQPLREVERIGRQQLVQHRDERDEAAERPHPAGQGGPAAAHGGREEDHDRQQHEQVTGTQPGGAHAVPRRRERRQVGEHDRRSRDAGLRFSRSDPAQ